MVRATTARDPAGFMVYYGPVHEDTFEIQNVFFFKIFGTLNAIHGVCDVMRSWKRVDFSYPLLWWNQVDLKNHSRSSHDSSQVLDNNSSKKIKKK